MLQYSYYSYDSSTLSITTKFLIFYIKRGQKSTEMPRFDNEVDQDGVETELYHQRKCRFKEVSGFATTAENSYWFSC